MSYRKWKPASRLIILTAKIKNKKAETASFCFLLIHATSSRLSVNRRYQAIVFTKLIRDITISIRIVHPLLVIN
ncbi:hypothetical protein CWO33_10870 [Vibrio splendidus]|nr:hypothetical protein CWO06_06195 [Vibrio splendidus]PTQ15082.1 hypothetical protein CWO33_10870 [Vibrio splendidus]